MCEGTEEKAHHPCPNCSPLPHFSSAILSGRDERSAPSKPAVHQHGLRVTGFLDGFADLTEDRSRPLGFDDVSGIIDAGGPIPGTSNRHDPFRVPVHGERVTTYSDRSEAVMATLGRHEIDALIVIGGDGSSRIADRLAGQGVPVVAVPKTIDNDV